MEPLKEMFNRSFYEHLALELKKVYAGFDRVKFIKDVTVNMEALSLNQRMRNTSLVLKNYLPDHFRRSVEILYEVVPNTRPGFTNVLFPDFVGLYGGHDIDFSLSALQFFTQFGSSEFAVREFLKRDFNKTIQTMYTWATDNNHHVRRLASEGSRPRLPWSFKLNEVISNPGLTLPILEPLKADPELYVRKSVANHLNDISKENPDYMLALISRWSKLNNPHTAWIIKHASRSLIKKGHSSSLSVFNFEKNVKAKISGFKLNKTKLKLGETLEFGFYLVSEKEAPQKLVVDYVVHYKKKSGALLPKVFKLKELQLDPKQKVFLSKKQLFADFTTRRHYAGKHLLDIQVNGKKLAETEFNLSI